MELTGSWSAWSGRAWWSVVIVVGMCCEGLCHSGPPAAKCVFSFDQWGIYTQGADVRESAFGQNLPTVLWSEDKVLRGKVGSLAAYTNP